MAIAPKEALALQSGVARGAARDDVRLVAALRAGDESAFASLVTDYQIAIYNLAWRLVHDREDARDIAQEVFLKAYRQIPKIEGELHLWAWLYRVTVNTCWDHLRARGRRPVSLGDRQEEADHGSGDGQDQAELARLFTASLAKLSPKQQVALLLKDVHGLPHSDIAATLGISRGSSEVLLFRARRSFRSAFTAMTATEGCEPTCRFAEQAAAYSVGGRLTEARRRRVLEHARTCPDCRKTVDRWSGVHAVGLGLALPLVAAPQLFGAHAAASAATNLAASAGAGASAAASAGASTVATAGASAAASTALTAGASSVVGGLTAKLAGLGIAKAAVVALAASTMVTYGGATAYTDYVKDGGRRAPAAAAAVAAATARSGAASVSPTPAATRPVAAVLAAAGKTPVAGDRRRPRPPAVKRFLALAALRARGLRVRALGLGPAARRAFLGAGRLPRLRQRSAARSAGARPPGARLPRVRAPGPRAGVRAGGASRPPTARAARRSEAAPGARNRPLKAQPPRAGVRRSRPAQESFGAGVRQSRPQRPPATARTAGSDPRRERGVAHLGLTSRRTLAAAAAAAAAAAVAAP